MPKCSRRSGCCVNMATIVPPWEAVADVVIVVRDLFKAQDTYMTTGEYLNLLPSLADQDFSSARLNSDAKPPKKLYGKDIDCPDEWRSALSDLLPREISYLGENDLMTKLPPAARAENMMIYIGHEGT
jgi:hypothetical protein